jgi:inhibitor of cysteine peptidase
MDEGTVSGLFPRRRVIGTSRLVIWGVLLVAAMGCRTGFGISGGMQTVFVTVQQDGETVAATVGDVVEVQLPAQMGTGFSWQMRMPNSGAVTSLGSPALRSQQGTQPGGGEIEVFRMKVRTKGVTTLRFEYRRPWEKDKPAAKSFAVTIRVV